MDDPKFKVGQKVTLAMDFMDPLRRPQFEIVSLLPAENRINRYRVKSAWDGHERAAMETELS